MSTSIGRKHSLEVHAADSSAILALHRSGTVEELWRTAAAAGRRRAWIGVSEDCAEEAEFCRCSWALRGRKRLRAAFMAAGAPKSAVVTKKSKGCLTREGP